MSYHQRMIRHGLRQLLHLKSQSLKLVLPAFAPPEREETSTTVKVIGWTSIAIGVAALGVLVGREIRIRYKFNRRTPYDYYAHSADRARTADCGMGI